MQQALGLGVPALVLDHPAEVAAGRHDVWMIDVEDLALVGEKVAQHGFGFPIAALPADHPRKATASGQAAKMARPESGPCRH